MKNRILSAALLAVCAVYAPIAGAELFGGAEAAFSHDTDFASDPDAPPSGSENIQIYSAYLGHYRPLEDKRSAFVVRGELAVVQLGKFNELEGTHFGVSAGLYRRFDRRHSMTATAGLQARRFEDSARNGETLFGQLRFKQKIHSRFWLREGLLLEQGLADDSANEYSGYGLQGSLNWSPQAAIVWTLGFARQVRIYEVRTGGARTSDWLSLGLVREFTRQTYVRAGVAQQSYETDAGVEYDSLVYTVGVGATF